MPPVRPIAANILEFQIRCELEAVRCAGERVRAFLRAQGCASSEITDSELAVVEACNNAVRYVRADARFLPVVVRVSVEPSELIFQIVDHTRGFDWPAKAALPQDRAEAGRGVFLIQALMDQTEYHRGSSENRLLMHKRRQGTRSADVRRF